MPLSVALELNRVLQVGHLQHSVAAYFALEVSRSCFDKPRDTLFKLIQKSGILAGVRTENISVQHRVVSCRINALRIIFQILPVDFGGPVPQ